MYYKCLQEQVEKTYTRLVTIIFIINKSACNLFVLIILVDEMLENSKQFP